MLAAFGLAAIGCAGLSRNRGGGSGSSGAVMWILAAVLATGLAGSAAALHFGRSDSRDRAPLTELRANGQATRVVTPVDDIALPINRGFDYFDALQAVRSRTGAAPFNVPSQVDNFTTYTGLPPARYTDLVNALNVLGESRWIAYRRFAVTHTVLTPPLSQRDEAAAKAAISGGRLFRRDPDWNISVWDIPHAPWARFAEKVLPASS